MKGFEIIQWVLFLVPETVNIHNFKNIPIGKYARFEKPEPYGRWKGIWDGTVLTRRVRQSDQFEKDIGKGLLQFKIRHSKSDEIHFGP